MKVGIFIDLFSGSLEGVIVFLIKLRLPNSGHDERVAVTMLELGGVHEDIWVVIETIFAKLLDVVPPFGMIEVPNDDLMEGLLNNVFTFIFALIFYLGCTVFS